MSASPIMSPMPVCEQCWLKEHARWEPHSMDGHGNIKMALSGVDVPQKINTGSVETCSGCGKITIAGIFDVKEQQIIFNAGEESQDYEEDEASDYYGEDTNE
jgi:hypothetical protein